MKTTTSILTGLALASPLFAQGFKTSEVPYLLATPGSDFTFEPVMTVGDMVPVSGDPASKYAFAGIPDAMGLYKDRVSGENILFVAHETNSSVQTTPLPGQDTYRGAFVSRYSMSADGGFISGSVAHKELFFGNTFAASDAPRGSSGPAFTRFCSGAFAGPAEGMDRPLFFTNEESGSGNYDAAGSQAVVVADGKMYTLPFFGRVPRETTRVQPRRDARTVIVSTEDGGSPSYVYLHVGTKQRRSSSVLDKNGLSNVKTYVLAGLDAQHNSGTFTSGSLPTKWVEIPNVESLTATQLGDAANDAGAFGFVRVEDAEFDPANPTRSLYLATTGGSGPNRFGRLYEVRMNPVNPVANGTMNVVYNADEIVTPGGIYVGAATGKIGGGGTGSLGNYTGGDINAGQDFPVSIDNLALSRDLIVICEDTNSPANAVYTKYARNSGVWTLDRTNNNAAKLQSTFNYAAIESRDGHPSGFFSAGRFESSGVIETESIFGPGTFVINVQGHTQSGTSGRTTAVDENGNPLTASQFRGRYAEDGQILILRPTP